MSSSRRRFLKFGATSVIGVTAGSLSFAKSRDLTGLPSRHLSRDEYTL